MKSKSIATVLMFLTLAACRSDTVKKKEPLFYQHPMRPDVHSSVPAKDEMGMDYIPIYEKEATRTESSMPGRSAVSMDPEAARGAGVKTSEASIRALTRKVQTYGTVAFDPSLYNALAEYREAVRARGEVADSPIPEVKRQTQNLVDAARLKLKLLGVEPSQIQNEKGLLLNEKGRGVWVYAEIYEQDVPVVHSGVAAVVSSASLPGQSIRGKVRSIDPTLNPSTRTSRARIELQTMNENLRPEMLVDVTLEVSLGKKLSVPTSAVLETGEWQYVYVEGEDRTFVPTPVKIGARLSDYTEIIEGVKEGARVVTHANFLIDSESKFQTGSAK
jgi:membrane fusion protein, copper/silver efflux system